MPKSKGHDDKRVAHDEVHKYMNTYNILLLFTPLHFTQLTLSGLTFT